MLTIPTSQRKKRDSKLGHLQLSHFPEVTDPASGRIWIQTQVFLTLKFLLHRGYFSKIMKTNNSKPFFKSTLLQKDLLMSASLSSIHISRAALCSQAPVVMQQETILLATLPNSPKFVGTSAEPPELPSTSPLVAPSSDKAAYQGKSENLNTLSTLKLGPKNSAGGQGKRK